MGLHREEYIRNEQIIDHADLDGVWISTFEPDATGITLSLAFGWSSGVPLEGPAPDRVSWDGDRDRVLPNLESRIET